MHRYFSLLIIVSFIMYSLYMPSAQAGEVVMPVMPMPGTRVPLSPMFMPAHLQGIVIHPNNALQFDFLVHRGDGDLTDAQKKQEYNKLIKYFLASLTIPEDHQWVNLSPYEQGRIIQTDFGKTEMGRDLLSQDYLLKQITSSLMYPESQLGKKFWDKVYAQAYAQLGTTNIPVNTFNKIWIVPDEAVVYESGDTAYIVKSHLKVMLEEDYLSLAKHSGVAASQAGMSNQTGPAHTVASKVIKQVILPILEKEVNEGKNFAMLRQIYSGMVLATWYKKALRQSLLGQVYANKDKVKGVDQNPQNNEAIYQKYLTAFKKGVYNYIKEDVDQYTNQIIPRKYFAGGFVDNLRDKAKIIPVTQERLAGIMQTEAPSMDRAMTNITPANLQSASTVSPAVVQVPVQRTLQPGQEFTFKGDQPVYIQAPVESAPPMIVYPAAGQYAFNGESNNRFLNQEKPIGRQGLFWVQWLGKEGGIRVINHAPGTIVQPLKANILTTAKDYHDARPFVSTLLSSDFSKYVQKKLEEQKPVAFSDGQFESRMVNIPMLLYGNSTAIVPIKVSNLAGNPGQFFMTGVGDIAFHNASEQAQRIFRVAAAEASGLWADNGHVIRYNLSSLFSNALREQFVEATVGTHPVAIHGLVNSDGVIEGYGDQIILPNLEGRLKQGELLPFTIRVTIDQNDMGLKSIKSLTVNGQSIDSVQAPSSLGIQRLRMAIDIANQRMSPQWQPPTMPGNTRIVTALPSAEKSIPKSDKNPNEDRTFVDPQRGLLLLADGAGGLAAGEVASQIAVDTFKQNLNAETLASIKNRTELLSLIQNVQQRAHEAIIRYRNAHGINNMATTLSMALIWNNPMTHKRELVGLSIGDSPIFVRHANGSLVQISEDDTYVQQLVKEGVITAEQAETHPQRNQIIDALGVEEHPAQLQSHQLFYRPLSAGDIVFAASDGVTDNLGMARMKWLAGRHADITSLVDATVQAAHAISQKPKSEDRRAKRDDISVAALQYKGDPAQFTKGGIDLNAANLNMQIKRNGKGVPLPLAQQDMSQLSRIQGFVPVILQIKPAATLPMLSQLHQQQESSKTI